MWTITLHQSPLHVMGPLKTHPIKYRISRQLFMAVLPRIDAITKILYMCTDGWFWPIETMGKWKHLQTPSVATEKANIIKMSTVEFFLLGFRNLLKFASAVHRVRHFQLQNLKPVLSLCIQVQVLRFIVSVLNISQSQWPSHLRSRSATARYMG